MTDCIEFHIDLPIGKAKHLKVIAFQHGTSSFVLRPSILGIVLGAVDLDDQSGRGTVEVHNVGVDDPLLVEFERVGAKELIPQF